MINDMKIKHQAMKKHTSSTHLMALTILYRSCSLNTGGPLCLAISSERAREKNLLFEAPLHASREYKDTSLMHKGPSESN